MPAARCSIDGINFPVGVAQRNRGACPICGEELALAQDISPDPDWQEQMQEALKRIEELENEAVHIGPPIIEGVDVYEEHGLLWASNFDLWPRLGYRPQSFSQLKIGEKLYEVQGWDEPRRRWWLEEVVPGD